MKSIYCRRDRWCSGASMKRRPFSAETTGGSQSRRYTILMLAVVLCAAPAFACGPFFPNTVLDQPAETLRAPTFAFDLTGLLPTNSHGRVTGSRDERASYQRGRSLLGKDDAEAARCFQMARRDPQLTVASIGWQARAELNRDHLIRAGELYIEHYATGDPTAAMSLFFVARRIVKTDEAMRAAARHPQLCRVVTVYLASHRDTDRVLEWLKAVEATGTVNLDCADRLAWTAYYSGNFDHAQRWLVRAPKHSASAGWLRTKLLLRAGKSEEAYRQLSETVRRFPQTDDWPDASKYSGDVTEPTNSLDQARGELAALQLGRREAVESLRLLLAAGYWTDAAYVAERVLTVDELAHCSNTDTNLQYLLARRLARLGRYAEARPLLPTDLQPRLDELAAAQTNTTAMTLWQAARTLRSHGMELTGTELAPDWHIHAGTYDWGFDDVKKLQPATAEVQPPLRFHYRYRAAELAWQAAALMPDNTDGTARVLHEAGSWLKDRDPKAADRFYKALVNRCGQTELGKAADHRRWF